MKTKTTNGQSRRDVLKLGVASVPVAAAAAIGVAEEAEGATVSPDGSPRLRRTAHVAKYFETARF